MDLLPVVMAGGSGTRLWPLSRQHYPKQFLALVPGEPTLLQATVARAQALGGGAPLLLCNEAHRFLVAEQLRAMGCEGATIVLEPEGRNTAPAIALAALQATQGGADALLLVLSADHHIPDTAAFERCIRAALPLAESGKLVTCGVVPTRAETGYGYIERGAALAGGFAIQRFVEKPDAATARSYLDSGRFFWNSGIFVFQASRYLRELERFAPAIVAACRAAVDGAQRDLTFLRVDAEAFKASPSDSIDYAVMEKTGDGVVVPLDARWSDLGSWSALWDVADRDADGNVLSGDVLTQASRGSYVRSTSRLVATVGVENLVIVETKDAVLVARKDAVQDVKTIVNQLDAAGRREHIDHRETYRPWGKYDSVDSGARYQVKRITVKPGAKLSTQMHHHRAEHWVVVRGTARITNGDQTYLLTENQSTYIPLGQVHALENPGRIDLELIEVQSGAYLGEDDIVRLADQYGRAASNTPR